MQITDLLVPERVALNMQVADKAMAIHAMVGMLDRTGCLRDAVEYEKNVLEREAQGTTGVGGGVAIPHGKSNAVLVPALAAVTLREAIDYQALDGAPVRLLFLIAAPDGANDLHIQVLARLAQLLFSLFSGTPLGRAFPCPFALTPAALPLCNACAIVCAFALTKGGSAQERSRLKSSNYC